MDMFWKFATLIKACIMVGIGFNLMGGNTGLAGMLTLGYAAIVFAEMWKATPDMIMGAIDELKKRVG